MDVLPDFREGDVGVNAHNGGGVANVLVEDTCGVGPPLLGIWVGLVWCMC